MSTIPLGKITRAKAVAITLTGDVGTITVAADGSVVVEVPAAVLAAAANSAQRWAANVAAQLGPVCGSVPVPVSADVAAMLTGPLASWSMAGIYALRWERTGGFSVAVTKAASETFLAALAKQVAAIDSPPAVVLPAGVVAVA